MPLTQRAAAYLSKMYRNPECVVDREELLSYLSASGVRQADAFLQYNELLSGYTLVTRDASTAFQACLCSKKEIQNGNAVERIEAEGLQHLYCGKWDRAPFYFVLGTDGELSACDGAGPVSPVFCSPEVFIENCALERHFAGSMNELAVRFDLQDREALLRLVGDWGHYREASDPYNYWCFSDDIVLHAGRWYDRSGQYVHLYGNTVAQAQEFAVLLQEQGILA